MQNNARDLRFRNVNFEQAMYFRAKALAKDVDKLRHVWVNINAV